MISAVMEPEKIILWSAPRCISTAFLRCISNLKEQQSKVFHEPFGTAYPYGAKGKVYLNRYPNARVPSLEEASSPLKQSFHGFDFVFVKDFPYYLQNHYEMFLDDSLKDFQHTFLVRNPQKSIRSLYKASCMNSSWGHYFDPREAGFKELLEMYCYVDRNIEGTPLVIDADDLLQNPDEMMRLYCQKTGIKYEEGMTKWEYGSVPPVLEDYMLPAPGFIKDVIQSSGLMKKEAETQVRKENKNVPKEVVEAIETNMPYYQSLFAKRVLLE